MSQIKEPKDPKGDSKKPRVFNLAAELNLDTKTVLEFCKELGFASIARKHTRELGHQLLHTPGAKIGWPPAAVPAQRISQCGRRRILERERDAFYRVAACLEQVGGDDQAAPRDQDGWRRRTGSLRVVDERLAVYAKR